MPKSLKSYRNNIKQTGVFYTPKSLALKLKSYIPKDIKEVYDPTCGSGSLLSVFDDDIKKYGQELDKSELEYCKGHLVNFIGFYGDTLKEDKFKNKKFDAIVANPPFSTKWEKDLFNNDERFNKCPLAPSSKADWAFNLHIINKLNDNGVAAVLCFPGIMYRGHAEKEIRKYFVNKNFIERIIEIEPKTFEDTQIQTNLLILKKSKADTSIIFERIGKEYKAQIKDIEQNDYCLSPNKYVLDDKKKEQININELNKTIVLENIKSVKKTISIYESLKNIFPNDNFYINELLQGLADVFIEFKLEEKMKNCLTNIIKEPV